MMGKISGFLKGMAAGVALGATVTMITNPLSERQKRKILRKTEGFFRNIGSALDTAFGMAR